MVVAQRLACAVFALRLVGEWLENIKDAMMEGFGWKLNNACSMYLK